MFKKAKLNLFWFLKPDVMLDLDDPGTRRMYVQQVLTHGRTEDVRELLKDIGLEGLHQTFSKIKNFLPKEVKVFWEVFFANHHPVSGQHP